MEGRDPADNGAVVLAVAVSVKLHKVIKDRMDIVGRYRAIRLSGKQDGIPRAADHSGGFFRCMADFLSTGPVLL